MTPSPRRVVMTEDEDEDAIAGEIFRKPSGRRGLAA
jgi:hypothetical protein